MSVLRTALAPSLVALSLGALLAPAAGADTIFLTDGSSKEDVEVKAETLKEVEYRESGRKQTVAADKVLRIEFTAMPQLVDRAEASARERLVLDAIDDMQVYVDGFLAGGGRERYEWAPAYAAWRLVQLQEMTGETDKVVAAAQRMIESFPDSRYVPMAYLAKAQAQLDGGSASKAAGTVEDLRGLVQTKGLGRRWEIECDLSKALYDASLKGDARRDKLAEVSSRAGSEFPTVRARAEVAIGESLLEAKKIADAEKAFRRVVDDPKASPPTLAAAFTGLGDCLFQRAAAASGAEAEKLRADALIAFMRVVVVYKDQVRYVPKAMFFAGRALDLSEDPDKKESAQKLYSAILRNYDGTSWATEARGFRKR